jgi:enoyl-CoA hydratase
MVLAQRMRRLAHKLEPRKTLAAFPVEPKPLWKDARVTFVTERASDGVVVVSADRPPVNAMNVELLEELVAALERLAAEPPAALVLAGREGVFSAGADLKAVPRYGPEEQQRMVAGINDMVLSAYGLPCPVVTAVTGHAIAGGLVLALCADHRVASLDGRYGLTEVKVGVAYPQAAIGVVRAELTARAARLLALGNRLTDASECVRLGVFDEVVAAAEVVERAVTVARELAAFPAGTYASTKHELRGATLTAMREAAARDPLLAGWVS